MNTRLAFIICDFSPPWGTISNLLQCIKFFGFIFDSNSIHLCAPCYSKFVNGRLLADLVNHNPSEIILTQNWFVVFTVCKTASGVSDENMSRIINCLVVFRIMDFTFTNNNVSFPKIHWVNWLHFESNSKQIYVPCYFWHFNTCFGHCWYTVSH